MEAAINDNIFRLPDMVARTSDDPILNSLGCTTAGRNSIVSGYALDFAPLSFDYVIKKPDYPLILVDINKEITEKELNKKIELAKEKGEIYVFYPSSAKGDLKEIVDNQYKAITKTQGKTVAKAQKGGEK